nr:serine/threonine-protein kinase PknD [uncultured bacterium]
MLEVSAKTAGDSPDSGSWWRGSTRYEVLGCLGRGGMGVVYEVFDRQRHERIALKTLLHFDADGLYRFKQEFRTLADIVHPNLVQLHELVAGERDEVLFTMELVEGTDFLGYVQKARTSEAGPRDAITARSGVQRARTAAAASGDRLEPRAKGSSPADFDRLRPTMRQLVEGVRALHVAGKLHRDLKPANVRVTPEGRLVILDFGVATELRRSAAPKEADEGVVGTAAYMAPEQACGEPVAASDWYSVGAMLYEAMVGRPPFSGSAIDVITQKVNLLPTEPELCTQGVPADLNALCMELLAPEPEQRPTADEILRRLGITPSLPAPAAELLEGSDAVRLIGRDVQLLALKEAFEAAREGRAVAVRVSGNSGMGKSAVVQRFLDDLENRIDVLVLRGRAYERESMPYKAVDSVVDALTRHLMDLQESERAVALPAETWALAHIFPVLRRVQSIDASAPASVGDPQLVRLHAFGVLRQVFAALSRSQRVVVFIDDVQWGDTDSAALLVELMRPPVAPPILLITTHRAEEAETSPFLVDLRARWPVEAEVHDLTVGPLGSHDARRLALALLGSTDATAQSTADAIAQESGGSPFLIEELARSASVEGADARRSLTLENLLGERVARLPDDARRLLETVAVGGCPLPVSTVGAASDTLESVNRLVALLRTRRFVRAGLRDGREVVEMNHDRIRETIVAQIPETVARVRHERLARTLEATPDSDPEAITTHLLGAGDKERAAHYAERAAEQALAKLAFAQAARLFQLTCDTISTTSPDARRLQRRVAEASEWAGYAEKAARAYLAAADGAPPLERVDLERAAAAQLIAAGRIDESVALSRRVLAAVGRRVPDSILSTIFWVVIYRIYSKFLTRWKLGDVTDLPMAERVRLDALHTLSRGLAVVDAISAMHVKARYLVDALRSGNRYHIVRAAAVEASGGAARGKSEGRRERELFDLARRLAEQTGDDEGYALYQITYGISEYVRGRWRSALQILEEACARLAAARRWQANANVYAVFALVYLGDLREARSRTTRLLADAERRGDLYTAVNLRASHPIASWVAADEVEAARRQIRESVGQWSKTRFLVQHWQAMLWETEIDLYTGDGARAWERLGRDARSLKKSHMLSVQLIRAMTDFVRGRSAIASLQSLPEGERGARLMEARRSQERLGKEAMPWTAPLAAILQACLANVAGDVSGAEGELRRAIELSEAAEMSLHAAAARLRLGGLVAGDQGRTMIQEAEVAMKTQGVRIPERYTQMLLPGYWPT